MVHTEDEQVSQSQDKLDLAEEIGENGQGVLLVCLLLGLLMGWEVKADRRSRLVLVIAGCLV